MIMNIPEGLTYEAVYNVDLTKTIDFIEPRILSTPSMIEFIEYTCRDMLKPYLNNLEDSVGYIINAKHIAITPLGSNVIIKASITKVEHNHVTFSVELYDKLDKIGEAIHERVIINKPRFIEKIKKKIEALS